MKASNKSYRALLVSALLGASEAGPIFNRLFQPLIQDACDAAIDGLGAEDNLNCDCSGSFKLFRGATVDADCSISPACADDAAASFCASGGTVGFEYNTPGVFALLSGDNTGFNGEVNACLMIDAGLPDGVPSLPDVCIDIQVDSNFEFDSCVGRIGETECVCTPCEGRRSLTLDCTAYNVLEAATLPIPGTVPGPTFECIGIDFAAAS